MFNHELCFVVAGEGRGEIRGHRHHAEVGLQKLLAAVCAICNALWLGKGYTRRDQHWVSQQFKSYDISIKIVQYHC